jgi:hypothetical protein
MKFPEISDTKGICKDVTNLGRWCNGDVEVALEELDQDADEVQRDEVALHHRSAVPNRAHREPPSERSEVRTAGTLVHRRPSV